MKELKKQRREISLMLIIMLASVVLYFVVIPKEIPLSNYGSDAAFTAQTFPRLLAVGIFLFSAVGFAVSALSYLRARKTFQEEPESDREEESVSEAIRKKERIAKWIPCLYFLIIFVYAFLFTKTGFIVSTIVTMPLMLAFFKCKNWKYYVIVYCFAAFIFAVFRFALSVPVP